MSVACCCSGGGGDPDYPLLSDIGQGCTPCTEAAQRYTINGSFSAAAGCAACALHDGLVVEWVGNVAGQCRWEGEVTGSTCNKVSGGVPCAGASDTAKAEIVFTYGPLPTTWRAQVRIVAPSFSFSAGYGMSDNNCLSQRTMNYTPGSGGGCCTWPSSITVAPTL